MAIQRSMLQRNDFWRRLPSVALLLTLVLAIGLAKPVLAATTTIADQASCVAFGGTWQFNHCDIGAPVTIAAGSTLAIQVPTTIGDLTNNGTLTVQSSLSTKASFKNNAGATVNLGGDMDVTQFVNEGTINITGRLTLLSRPSLNRGAGQINVRSGATLTVRSGTGLLTNTATITIDCGGTMVYDSSTFTGTAPKDMCLPSVTVNQAATQVDPVGFTPIRFVAVFRQAVTGFTATDVSLSGTANRAGATVSISGGPSSYTVDVDGITGNGTVIATIPANAVTDAEGQGNPASTSTDNSVTFKLITAIADQASCVAFGGTWQFNSCDIGRPVTIAAGATLAIQVPTTIGSLTNNGTLSVQSSLSTKASFTNNAGATVNVVGNMDVTQFVNEGTINITGSLTLLSRPALNRGAGQINVRSGATLTVRPGTGLLTNTATITIECGGTMVYDSSTFTGTAPKDICPPSVTVNQAATQADPTKNNPVLFTASFRQAVTGFTMGDVILGGTADRSHATVTISGGPSNYTISVNGVTGNGTVIATIPANAVIDAEGQGNPASTSTDNTVTFFSDATSPTANPFQLPNVVANGWTDGDVTVTWRWRDNTGGSGLDTTRCTTSSKSSGEGVQTLTATCQDRVGNVGTANYTVKVDKTGPTANPTQSPAANAAGWNNTPVTVNWNWTDAGSGLEPGSCNTTSSSSQGNGTQTLTASCFDQAGHLTSASYTVKVDRAWPQILANVSPSPSGLGWYASAVTVSFTCQEQGEGSGLATNTVGGNTTLSSEGTYPAITNTGTCTDKADNVAIPVTVGPFNIDLTKPTISAAATTAPNANGWYNSNVTVHFTCADALSGIAFCPGDETLSSEGSAVAATAQTGRDRAQNSSDPSNVVTVKIDKTAPVVAVTGVTDGATYAFGSVPTAACNTSDALSDVATAATLSVTGGNPDGSGAFTATCSGSIDKAGNSAAAVNVSYTVGTPLPTATPTNTLVPSTATPTNTSVPPTATDTSVPPTATPTNTAVPPTVTATDTSVPPTATPTNTSVPPTATPTNTAVPPTVTATNTPVPPTATPTNTSVPPTATPTNTAVPPTEIATNTPVPPTATPTNTSVPPTATPTNTLVPPTATPTNTAVPPTATPTNTAVPPTATFTATPTPIPLAQCSEPILGAVAWLHEYSLITGGNFSTSSDVQGKAFIGGNLTSSNSATFGSQLNQGSFPATTASLEIAGSVANGNPLNINAGSVLVGPSNTVQMLNPTQHMLNNNRYVNLNQGNSGATVSINNTLSTKASTITTKLQQGAVALSQIAANNSVTIPTGQPGPLTFNVTAKDSDGLAVFNVSAVAIFDNNKVQQIEINNTVNASNILINVSDTSVNWTNGNKVGSWLTSTNGRAHTIWNFYQATTINLGSRNFMGTLLAPSATVSFQGQFNGSLGAAAVTANAAIQQPLLAGNFCSVVPASLADQGAAQNNLLFLPLINR